MSFTGQLGASIYEACFTKQARVKTAHKNLKTGKEVHQKY
jgi:hypothetical protein